MRDTDEVLVGALEYFCTTLFAQLLPVAKQKIDGIAIICIFESHKVIAKFGTEVLAIHAKTDKSLNWF